MKAKVTRGNGFRGVLDYALGEKKEAEIVGGNMVSTTARELAAEFKISRKLRSEAKNPVAQFSLALPAGEALSNEKWSEVADAFMQKMGFENNQYTAIKHEDTEYQHVHIIASRIGLNSELWHGRNDVFTAIQATQELEMEFGLTITPGLDSVLDEEHEKKPTKNEVEKALRTGEAPERILLQNIINEALKEPSNVTAFIAKIEASGAEVRPNIASTGKLNGFSFSLNGVAFKGSDLGKKYTWTNLQKSGINYEQNAESGGLIAKNSAANAAKNTDRAADSAANTGISTELSGSNKRQPHDNQSNDQTTSDSIESSRNSSSEQHSASKTDSTSNEQDAAKTRSTVEQKQDNSTANNGSERLANWRSTNSDIADIAAPLAAKIDAPIITRALKTKQSAWQKQSAGLNSSAYRITLKSRRDNLNSYNLGKRKDADEVFYTAAEVAKLLPKLSVENAKGYDIYITPIDSKNHFILVDDMTSDSKNKLIEDGFKPCLIQKSSDDNFQAVLKIPKRTDGISEQREANKVVGLVNKKYGDEKLSGVIHPFRLAGFSNKKEGRNNAFTVVSDANARICEETADILNTVKADEEKEFIEVDKVDRRNRIELAGTEKATGSTVNAYKKAYAKHENLAKAKGWEIDSSAIDFRVASELLKAGHKQENVANAMLSASPDIMSRHSNPQDYASRTVTNASSKISENLGSSNDQQLNESRSRAKRHASEAANLGL